MIKWREMKRHSPNVDWRMDTHKFLTDVKNRDRKGKSPWDDYDTETYLWYLETGE